MDAADRSAVVTALERLCGSSAQPFYGANALPAGAVDVEAVYAGLGSRPLRKQDVRGKAVFVFNQAGLKNRGRPAPMTRALR